MLEVERLRAGDETIGRVVELAAQQARKDARTLWRWRAAAEQPRARGDRPRAGGDVRSVCRHVRAELEDLPFVAAGYGTPADSRGVRTAYARALMCAR